MTTNIHITKTFLSSLFFLLLSASGLRAQEFQRAFTDFNVANDFSRDSDGNLFVVGYTSFKYEAALDEIVSFDIINKLNNQGEVIWARDFEINGSLTEIQKTLAMPIGDVIILFTIDKIGENLQLGLARISSEGTVVWSQTMEADISGFDQFNTELSLIPSDGNNFYVQAKKVSTTQQTHLLTKFNGSGEVLTSKNYTTDLKINTSSIVAVDDEQLALIGYYTTDTNTRKGILMLLDNDGQVRSSATYTDTEIQGIIPDGDGYILKFKQAISSNAGVMKVDNNLDIAWSKEIDFEVEGQLENIQKFGDDSFVMYVYDNRSRTELLGRYDMEGETIWSKYIESKYSGRPFTEKIINADGQILMMSNIWTTDLKSSIFRQIPLDGNSLECRLPIACEENFQVATTKEDISMASGNPTTTVEPITISLTPTTKSTSNFCQEAAGVPSAVFELDSTACINEVVEVFNTMNGGADDVSWSISGGPDEAILPLASLNNGLPIAFADTGLYTITQFITYKGCVTNYDQETEITEGLPFSFAEDKLILCQDEIKTVNANRPGFVSYLWLDDNSPDPIKKIDSPGIYTVELYDGSCTKSYDLEAVDFDYGGIEFSLGPDTTVCEFRRFTLAADVIRDGVDYLWNDGVNSGERYANKEGEYNLTVSLDGCDYTDDILVTFEPCEPQVYMPNVFSPNADGFNDTLFPAGKNFELVSFRVYNRWGALLHDDLSPWDGAHKNQKLNGVYVYNISFLNVRSGDIERMAGSVYIQM